MEQQVRKRPDAKTLDENSIIPIGKKHKDKTVEQVIKEDPGWILWAQNKLEAYSFTTEVLARCSDRNTVPISFSFNVDELKENTKIISSVEQGLDPYGDRGVRQLHGFNDKDNIHKALTYYRKLSEYLIDQLLDQPTIQINKA
jgi:hypothetical protein